MPTVRELRARAEELGIELPKRAVKAELEEIIERETPGTVLDAVTRELRELGATQTALGASARSLAREMDDDNSATSKSMCARALVETMDRIRELLAEQPEEADPVDELKARRESRLARTAAAQD